MTRRDNLLKRLEQVNPVPDPSQLYEDLEMSRQHYLAYQQRRNKTMTGSNIDQLTTERQGPRVRRGLLIGATAAALVLIVGLAYAFVIPGGGDVVSGESRVLKLTFDGEQCLYEGPSELSPGEVEIGFENLSAERVWFDFVRLDDDKTIQDVLDYQASRRVGRPSFVSGVWSPTLSAGSSSTGHMAVLEPGLHVLVCGTSTPYVGYFGAGLTVE